MSAERRPVALVTGEVSAYRERPFRMLAEAEGVEVLAHRDARAPAGERVSQLEVVRLIGGGRFRAVICGIGGRVALPGSYLAARRARVPFVLWTSLWAHPRTPAHALSWPVTRHFYRHADAVVTYGPHVTRYVERHRRGPTFEAPQAVSAELFGRKVTAQERAAARALMGAREEEFALLFVGRLVREKGVELLLEAWRRAALDGATLAIAGEGPLRTEVASAHVRALGQVARTELPALYAAADALAVPSVRSATFLEPWGLVVNEAMHSGTPVIASDAVGAVAGGLVRDGRNGLVVRAGDVDALALRIRTLAAARELRAALGTQAREDVARFSEKAWVEGMQAALRAVGASRGTLSSAQNEPSLLPDREA